MACIEAAAAGRAQVRLLPGRQSLRLESRRRVRRPGAGQARHGRLSEHHAEHGPCPRPGQETIILPVLARDEEPQPTTQESMFSYVRLSDGGPARHAGPRSEVEIIAELARRVLGDARPDRLAADGANTARFARRSPRSCPAGRRSAEIDRTKQEFQIAGPAAGRASVSDRQRPRATARPRLAGRWPADRRQLRLMTVRSEGQFNTVVYEDYDLYRGQDRRDVILLHPDDLARLGLADGHAGDGAQRSRATSQRHGKSFRQDQAGQRADVLSGGQRAGAAPGRSGLADAGLQERAGHGGSSSGRLRCRRASRPARRPLPSNRLGRWRHVRPR